MQRENKKKLKTSIEEQIRLKEELKEAIGRMERCSMEEKFLQVKKT